MKRILFYTILILVLGAVFMELMRHDPGYILIRFGGKALETTFWAALIFIVFMAVNLSVLYVILKRTWRWLDSSVHFFSYRKHKRIEEKTQSGMLNYVEGNWHQAKKDLQGVAKSSDQPLLPYLAAAQSAYEEGDIDETKRLLAQAEKSAPENDLALAISLARFELLDKNYEACLETLKRVYDAEDPHPVVVDLLKDVLFELNDWHALKTLLPTLRKLKSNDDYSVLESKVFQQDFFKKITELEKEGGLTKLDTIYKELPKRLRFNSDISFSYAAKLEALGDVRESSTHVQKSLKKEWSNKLVELYASLDGGDEARRYKTAQEWSKRRPEDYFLLNMLARMAARRGDIDQAKALLEKSLTIEEHSNTYSDYGLLLARAGEYERSTQLFEKSLMLSQDK